MSNEINQNINSLLDSSFQRERIAQCEAEAAIENILKPKSKKYMVMTPEIEKNIRGYFEIGIYHTKTVINVGTLWRSAYQLGASGIFTIGKRYPHQTSDTLKTYRHIPYREYLTFEEFLNNRPFSCLLIGIEMGGKPLVQFHHPERAIYLLGAEDHGLPDNVLKQCNLLTSIESIRTESYNVAVAGSIVMYHRFINQNHNDLHKCRQPFFCG